MKNDLASGSEKVALESEFPAVGDVPLKETTGIPLIVLEYPGP
jgi:hypothetical protein